METIVKYDNTYSQNISEPNITKININTIKKEIDPGLFSYSLHTEIIIKDEINNDNDDAIENDTNPDSSVPNDHRDLLSLEIDNNDAKDDTTNNSNKTETANEKISEQKSPVNDNSVPAMNQIEFVKCDINTTTSNFYCESMESPPPSSSLVPLKCQTCGKNFTRLISLKQHQRVHTGERPYKCTTCGKTFNIQQNLKVHMRLHTGEKPYSCDICGKRYTHLTSMNVHRRTHTSERPYTCGICGSTFLDSSSMKRHEFTHKNNKFNIKNKIIIESHSEDSEPEEVIDNGVNRYYCKICGIQFTYLRTLKMHERDQSCYLLKLRSCNMP